MAGSYVDQIRRLTEDPGCLELARIADTLQARLDACCPPSSVRLAPAGLAAAPTPTAPTTTGDSKVP